jgi:MFS family permease
MSIPYIISIICSPIFGHLVDKYGKMAYLSSLSVFMLIVVHLFLGFTRLNPILWLILQGLAYSCFTAVIFPIVILLVKSTHIGIGFGVITSIQNIG